jgi:hypothetical protein
MVCEARGEVMPCHRLAPIARFTLALLASLFLPASLPSSSATAGPLDPPTPQIWLGAGARTIDPQTLAARNDRGDMWAPDAPWQTVASHVQVAIFPPGNIQNAKDADLAQAIADLNRRHISIALGISLLSWTPICQPRLEGYLDSTKTLLGLAEKIKRNGGELRYVEMDEPFFYAHRYSGPGACHERVADIARRVAENVRLLRTVFPQVQIGDAEVVGASRAWIDELGQWADSYRAATGEPLAFLHADVDWSGPALENLKPLAAALQGRHIPFGVFYVADASANSDEAFEASAIDHFTEIESALGVHPDHAIFTTWVHYPTHTLPETTPGTLTNVALRYLQPATSLTLQRTGDAVGGRVTDQRGQPIANAKVTLEAVDIDAATAPTERSLTRTVPTNAATAVVGIRANLEGSCVCAGEAGAIVGGIHYREQGTNRHEDISPVSLPITGAPASVRTLKLTPDMNYAPNLQQFPVTAGATFMLTTTLAATANADRAGYVTIVFLDKDGKGVRRDNLWFEPSRRPLGEVTTGPDGGFQMRLPAEIVLAHQTVRATFQGSAERRPAMADLALRTQGNATAPALVQPLANPRGKLVVFAPRKDFLQLFENGASWDELSKQWAKGASYVNMIGLNEGQIRAMPDEALARLVHELNAHHLALNLGILATNWFHEPSCGGGVEGYSDPGSANATVAKLLRAGASPSTISMDEPLFFGHYFQGKNACKSSIDDVARRTAVIVKIYTAAFPNLIAGDSEPFPAISNQPGWQADYAKWVQAFHRETGTPLSFTDIDINWGDPRLSRPGVPNVADAGAIAALSRSAAEVLRANGLAVGMFYTGFGAGPLTDAKWLAQAREHMDAVERAGINPDRVVITSWDRFPTHTLPENDPSALASLAAYYVDRSRR